MHKLITIELDGASAAHGDIQEHLSEYLEDGWTVRHVACMAAGGGAGFGYDGRDYHNDEIKVTVVGWVVVTLERV